MVPLSRTLNSRKKRTRYQRVSVPALVRLRATVATALGVAAFAGGLAIQTAAQAIPIGDFSWSEHTEDECAADLCGVFFSVGNFSSLDDPSLGLGLLGGSFFDVFVELQTGDGPRSLSLGSEIPSFDSRQSFEDLSALTVLSAGLRLAFVVPTLPGSVRLLDADGNVVAGLTAPGFLTIDYAIDEVVPVPVPEPSALLLLAGGLIGMAVGRRARRQNATPETSRMKPSSRHVFAT
jgi:hypothetical protein